MGPGPVTKLPATQGGLRAIIFDLDGTLYQDDRLGKEVHQSACRYVAFLKGVTVAEAEDLLRGARCEVSESGGTLSRAVLALGGDLKELHNRFSREVHPKGILALDPRVPELLRKLAGRFELYLYTNNNRELSARIMEQIGVGGFFKKVFSIEDYWLPKPDHAALQGILEAIGRKPGETLFVGDRYEVDLEFPASLGCAVFEARTVDELLTLVKLVD
jgi:putative hydrolase of the HAD superfamily